MVAMSSALPSFLATDPDVYEHFMGRWSARLAEPFLEFAGVKYGDRVLDVGCGTGTISLALAKRGAKTVGLDASESYLDGARRLRSHPNVTYVLRRMSRRLAGLSVSKRWSKPSSSPVVPLRS
jgi:tRNA/tmRNA/rRNA uracil-C5-methylase (TrmA/RlmC/RlmD family)